MEKTILLIAQLLCLYIRKGRGAASEWTPLLEKLEAEVASEKVKKEK